jgi:hypothetical protein
MSNTIEVIPGNTVPLVWSSIWHEWIYQSTRYKVPLPHSAKQLMRLKDDDSEPLNMDYVLKVDETYYIDLEDAGAVGMRLFPSDLEKLGIDEFSYLKDEDHHQILSEPELQRRAQIWKNVAYDIEITPEGGFRCTATLLIALATITDGLISTASGWFGIIDWGLYTPDTFAARIARKALE